MTASNTTPMNYIFYVILTIAFLSISPFYFTVVTEQGAETLQAHSIQEIFLQNPILEVLSMTAVHSRKIKTTTHNKSWTFKPQNTSLGACSVIPPGLKGPYQVDPQPYSWNTLAMRYPWLEDGGHGTPDNCIAQHRVAVIIPYRNREQHLKVLLNNLHDFLRRQQLDYTVVVVEPIANQTFNRAKLMNIGYMEAMKIYPWECFIFHDVDLLPEDDRLLYSCPVMPRHMSVAIDIFNYTLPFETIFGGVTAMTVDHMRNLNGFSNDFWGWGGEDDDLYKRVKLAGYNHTRYPSSVARYKMHRHQHAAEDGNHENGCRWQTLNVTESRWQVSGLKNLNYKVEKTNYYPLYTHVLVDLFEEESREDLLKHVKC